MTFKHKLKEFLDSNVRFSEYFVCEITSLSAFTFYYVRRKERTPVQELIFGLDVVKKILSDPIWRKRAEKVSCKEELRVLLLQFCSENGEIIKVDEKTILLY